MDGRQFITLKEKKIQKYVEQTQQEYEGWEEFFNKPVDEKLENFKRKDRIFDIIYAQQFDSRH
jgi:hypothetical protein